ncbi:hypothetical protein B0H13DRAFT_1865237 [Mycena leptocephala]|nr:hypothetical protein B0H13DRAFT_1865237 [Mycena leptocephala]
MVNRVIDFSLHIRLTGSHCLPLDDSGSADPQFHFNSESRRPSINPMDVHREAKQPDPLCVEGFGTDASFGCLPSRGSSELERSLSSIPLQWAGHITYTVLNGIVFETSTPMREHSGRTADRTPCAAANPTTQQRQKGHAHGHHIESAHAAKKWCHGVRHYTVQGQTTRNTSAAGLRAEDKRAGRIMRIAAETIPRTVQYPRVAARAGVGLCMCARARSSQMQVRASRAGAMDAQRERGEDGMGAMERPGERT